MRSYYKYIPLNRKGFPKSTYVFILFFLFLINPIFAFWTVASPVGYISMAKFKKYDRRMFLSLQSGGGHYTSYGIFVFDPAQMSWATVGQNAACVNDSFQYGDLTFQTKNFFIKNDSTEIADGDTITWIRQYKYQIRQTGDTLIVVENNDVACVFPSIIPDDPHKMIRQSRPGFNFFDGENLWFTLWWYGGDASYMSAIGFYELANNKIKMLNIKSPETGCFPGVSCFAKYGSDILIGTAQFSDWGIEPGGSGLLVVDPVKGEAIKTIDTTNSPLLDNSIVTIEVDDDNIWIVTIAGVCLWRIKENKWITYKVDSLAEIVGNPARAFKPNYQAAKLGYLHDAQRVHLIKSIDGGFYDFEQEGYNGWYYNKHDFPWGDRFSENQMGDTILLKDPMIFYEKPDTNSDVLGDISNVMGCDIKYIWLEKNDKWMKFKLDKFWIPAENIKCSLIEIKE